jgi:hypothetical protein
MNGDPLYHKLKVNAADRQYQVWERNSLSIDLFTEEIFLQKLNYIHNNPMQPKWNLATLPEDYYYSSACFYATGQDEFDIITHYKE